MKPARAAEAPPNRKMQIARVATIAREKAAIVMASLLRGEDADAVEMDAICWNKERNEFGREVPIQMNAESRKDWAGERREGGVEGG